MRAHPKRSGGPRTSFLHKIRRLLATAREKEGEGGREEAKRRIKRGQETRRTTPGESRGIEREGETAATEGGEKRRRLRARKKKKREEGEGELGTSRDKRS